jgi:hypothetical protein
MGIFGDLDVQAAADDPFAVDDGTYNATISACEVKPTKDETKTGLILTYTITDEGNMTGRKVSEWKQIPKPGDSNADSAASWLKQRLLSIGIPSDRINSFEPDDAIGIDVVITVKNNNGYANVNKVVLAGGSASSSDSGNSFANL